MRSVVIMVRCDLCKDHFEEHTEGSNHATFEVAGNKWEMDICDLCLGSSFLREARPVVPTKSKEKKVSCDTCGRMFGTKRGMTRHAIIAHPKESS